MPLINSSLKHPLKLLRSNYIFILILAIFISSCGKSKTEVEQNKAQLAQIQKEAAAQEEQERIHQEKIEVGDSKKKIFLTNELDRVKKILQEEENNLAEIEEFQIGRSSSTKERQLFEQQKQIRKIENYITSIEEEISLIHLHPTFDFQDSPEGVLGYIFKAAEEREFGKLRHLLDPYFENDADAGGIGWVQMQPAEMQDIFVDNFKTGRLMGEPEIKNNTAILEIAMGPSSWRLQKITLIKRLDKWYLLSL
jgi:hypothetical protein